MPIDTVIFDLDGVLIETEQEWNEVRKEFAARHGGHWSQQDQPALMGANSMQWAEYMRDKVGVDLSPREIYEGVVNGLRDRYSQHLPLIPGAWEAVTGLAAKYKLGVASSSPLELIEYSLVLAGLRTVLPGARVVGRGGRRQTCAGCIPGGLPAPGDRTRPRSGHRGLV